LFIVARRLRDELLEGSEASSKTSFFSFEGWEQQDEDVDEVHMYQAMGRPDEATANDVLAWWRFHETTYPNLAELAREVFPIQGSSCSSERVFCHSGGVLTDKRSCTDPRNFGD